MKKTTIYEYKNYKSFILDWIEKTPSKGRGQRRSIAEAIGCQNPFISHVLSGDYHFSAEQAEACSRYMGLNEQDSEFFLKLETNLVNIQTLLVWFLALGNLFLKR